MEKLIRRRGLAARLAAVGAATGLALMSVSATPASAKPSVDPSQAVASDGSVVKALRATSAVGGTSSFSGTAPQGGVTKSIGAKAADTGPALHAGNAQEVVIGTDQRFRINPTTSFPARATVLITFDGGRCSGWLYDDDTVATAGHCVHTGGSGGSWRTGFTIYPGYNGSSGAPYGSCGWVRAYSVAGWTQSGNEEYDYGAIKLNCSIGNTVGWYGYWWQSASLNGLSTTIYGYPGDKPYEQWGSSGSVADSATRKIYYKNDTAPGDSGAPVWQTRGSGASYCQGSCVMGVHAYGPHGSGSSASNNSATRLTEAAFNNYQTWRS